MPLLEQFLKNWMQHYYHQAYLHHARQALKAVEFDPYCKFLDLGCAEGLRTIALADRIGTSDIAAVDIDTRRSAMARAKGIRVVEADLDKDWHFVSEQFDAVHAGFVLEYANGVDHFVSELHRVIKPGGYVLVGTENGSSWHNILASVLGWQNFSSSECSLKTEALGNPLALYLGTSVKTSLTQTQKVIFNPRGLEELFWYHGFSQIQIFGSGYYPLPAPVGALDPRHAHLLLLKAKKV